MPKKIEIEDAIPGIGDCAVIRADGETVATVRPADEGMWRWFTPDGSERVLSTAQMRERVKRIAEDEPVEPEPPHVPEFTAQQFKEFLVDLAPYRRWLCDALDHYNAALARGGAVAVYLSTTGTANVCERDAYRLDGYVAALQTAGPASVFPRAEPGECFELIAVYRAEPIAVTDGERASVPVASRADELMRRDWPRVLNSPGPSLHPVRYVVHECTDGLTLGPSGATTGFDSRWDHTGTCGNWTIHGPYETEEKAMQWRSARHVVILLDTGGTQSVHAEFIGGNETRRSAQPHPHASTALGTAAERRDR